MSSANSDFLSPSLHTPHVVFTVLIQLLYVHGTLAYTDAGSSVSHSLQSQHDPRAYPPLETGTPTYAGGQWRGASLLAGMHADRQTRTGKHACWLGSPGLPRAHSPHALTLHTHTSRPHRCRPRTPGYQTLVGCVSPSSSISGTYGAGSALRSSSSTSISAKTGWAIMASRRPSGEATSSFLDKVLSRTVEEPREVRRGSAGVGKAVHGLEDGKTLLGTTIVKGVCRL